MQKNIILVGFMGAGKTLVSKKLAAKLKAKVVSTDDLIAAKEKRAITDIFRDSGEPYFRRLEREVVAEVSKNTGLIVDCGGGVVLDPENLVNLKKNGVVFFLSATPQALHKRTKGHTHRPLLNTEDPLAKITELLSARQSFYAQADHSIETDGKSGDAVAEEIIAIMVKEESRK